jgi:hypothetical protein
VACNFYTANRERAIFFLMQLFNNKCFYAGEKLAAGGKGEQKRRLKAEEAMDRNYWNYSMVLIIRLFNRSQQLRPRAN